MEGVIRVLDQPASPNCAWSDASLDPSSSTAPWRIYNIGNNSPVRLIDFITALESSLNIKANLKMLPLQAGDMPETYADITDLIEKFDYRPTTSLHVGIDQFVRWYRSYFVNATSQFSLTK